MKVKVKSTEVQISTQPEIVFARRVVARLWSAHSLIPTITSSWDGQHKAGSLHYTGLAEDYRTKDIADRVLLISLVSKIRSVLGSDYDVLLEDQGKENEHIHIEYDPKP